MTSAALEEGAPGGDEANPAPRRTGPGAGIPFDPKRVSAWEVFKVRAC